MKRSVSIIAAAAMAASLTLAGSMSAFAADAETTTQAATEATPATTTEAATAEPAVKLEDITGKWIYQEADGNTTVDKASKNNGVVEVSNDGAFTYTDAAGKTVTGTVKTGSENIGGTDLATVKFDTGNEDTSFGGYYRSETKQISIGNGGMIRLVRESTAPETTTTASAAETTTTTAAPAATTTKASASTTKSAGTTTTKSAGTTTTKAGTKSGNPKTGVAFPAVAASGLAVAAVSVAFALRKKED